MSSIRAELLDSLRRQTDLVMQSDALMQQRAQLMATISGALLAIAGVVGGTDTKLQDQLQAQHMAGYAWTAFFSIVVSLSASLFAAMPRPAILTDPEWLLLTLGNPVAHDEVTPTEFRSAVELIIRLDKTELEHFRRIVNHVAVRGWLLAIGVLALLTAITTSGWIAVRIL